MALLKPHPDFLNGARTLVQALANHPDPEARTIVLNRVAKRLGDDLYPAFIKILSVVGESDDLPAKSLVAETLAHAMLKGDMPNGTLTSWGIPNSWVSLSPALAGSFFRTAPRRNLGPIEYLSAWYCQATDRSLLGNEIYGKTLASLLNLFNASPSAARVYQSKLASDALNEPEGTFTQTTRSKLTDIAQGWARGTQAEEIVRGVLHRDLVGHRGLHVGQFIK